MSPRITSLGFGPAGRPGRPVAGNRAAIRSRSLTRQLAKAEKDETLQLESIPAYSFVAKQVVKDERQSDLDKKLLGPDGPSPGARDLHEDVKRYMLENDVPAEKYVDALHTVAGED